MMKINRITQAAQCIAVLKGRFIHHERYIPLAA